MRAKTVNNVIKESSDLNDGLLKGKSDLADKWNKDLMHRIDNKISEITDFVEDLKARRSILGEEEFYTQLDEIDTELNDWIDDLAEELGEDHPAYKKALEFSYSYDNEI